jgi:hypothetical protein
MRSLLVVVLVACGPTPPAQDPDTPRRCLDAPTVECLHTSLEYFANTMCSCTSKACAERTADETQKWGVELAKVAPKEQQPDPAAEKRSEEIMKRYSRCLNDRLSLSKQGGW